MMDAAVAQAVDVGPAAAALLIALDNRRRLQRLAVDVEGTSEG